MLGVRVDFVAEHTMSSLSQRKDHSRSEGSAVPCFQVHVEGFLMASPVVLVLESVTTKGAAVSTLLVSRLAVSFGDLSRHATMGEGMPRR